MVDRGRCRLRGGQRTAVRYYGGASFIHDESGVWSGGWGGGGRAVGTAEGIL